MLTLVCCTSHPQSSFSLLSRSEQLNTALNLVVRVPQISDTFFAIEDLQDMVKEGLALINNNISMQISQGFEGINARIGVGIEDIKRLVLQSSASVTGQHMRTSFL